MSNMANMSKTFNQHKWNITKSYGDKISYDMIYKVLYDYNDVIDINILIQLLNEKTSHIDIKHNNKNINIVNYLKIANYGILRFIDDYEIFGVIKKNNHTYIQLMEDYLEWEIIDNEFLHI